ncbi:lipoprotein insertase outer membrane protein LolB [Undibacterium sp. Dicai25W]|uniref:lipoprotein insertase outer membrane protein LolB n=1 Tax=Undibacterium sp. Dicai25W TaxID=3413034 RepID=UPI003BF56381
MTFKYSRWLTLSVMFASLILCSACASIGMQQAQNSVNATSFDSRTYQDNIQLSGKISVRYEKDNKPQQLPGSFEWEQSGQHLRINLLSPLGQTLARITLDDSRAILEQEGQSPRYAQNLDQLLQESLGWSLPVAGMRDWLQGFIPQENGQRQALIRVDQTLQNSGWTLRYASWQDHTDLPKRIELSRYTQQAGNVSISIFIQAPNP